MELLEDLPTVARGGGRVRRELDAAGLAHLLRPIAGDVRLAIVEQVASRPVQEVAAALEISVEAARQIEIRALRKVRRALEDRGLSADDLLPDPSTDRDALDQHDDQDGSPE